MGGWKLSETDAGALARYKHLFAAGSFGIRGGYAEQPLNGTWFNPNRKLSDYDITGHLNQEKYIAFAPAYFPECATIDVDFPQKLGLVENHNVSDKMQVIRDQFRLTEGEYHEFASPSYHLTGNRHLFFCPQYKGQPVSSRQIQRTLRPLAASAKVELFPCGKRKIRAPFGFHQYLLDPETGAPLDYGWEECLDWVEKLSPVDLERFPFHPPPSSQIIDVSGGRFAQTEATYIWQHGLQMQGSRHQATGLLARLLYRLNLSPEMAKAELRRWIREKHNGMSEEVAKRNWPLVDREIDNWVDGTYSYYERVGFFPNSVHNQQGWMTRQDVGLILEMFKGDIVNQKRFFKLIQYVRGRTMGEIRWIPVRGDAWHGILGSRYSEFLEQMEQHFLQINNSYSVGLFSKRFLLRIPPATQSMMIADEEGRAVQKWIRVLLSVYGDIRQASLASGISRQRFYDE